MSKHECHNHGACESHNCLSTERNHSMSKAIPSIYSFMTTCPHTIGHEQNIESATDLMREHKIRHLPVLKGGVLSGIISDRDIKLCLDFVGADESKIKVGDVCSEDVYTVAPQSPLDEVAKEMARKKVGSAVVLDHNKVVGIFTSVDAMNALATLLATRLHSA